jgi:hypothetical protein
MSREVRKYQNLSPLYVQQTKSNRLQPREKRASGGLTDTDVTARSITNLHSPRHYNTYCRFRVRGNLSVASAHYGLSPEVFTRPITYQ